MIVVIGYGITGRAVEAWARERGSAVLVVDDAPDRIAASVDTETGLAALDDAELIVPSPGVRPTHPIVREATERQIPIMSELDLAASESSLPLVAVTATNGKTTVTTLIADMLASGGIAATTAGNIGHPLLEAVTEPVDVIVVEASSFQLATSTSFRPRVAVLLNIAEDHLDWHGSVDAYIAAKSRIFAHQGGDDVLVYNADDPLVASIAERAPARSIPVSVDVDIATVLAGARLPEDLDPSNALMAATAARVAGASDEGVRRGLAHRSRLPHRVVPVGEAGGVRWIDDSKATNPHAANHAIARFDSVVLIAGGRNKGLDFRRLRDSENRLRAVVAMGESAGELVAAFADSRVPVERATSMRDAVARAAALARPGDTVLLSPACTSFDGYRSYSERGDDFAAEARVVIERMGGVQ